ncbi:hypothetical protein SDC9_146901 [bioreactor metagenome]|uniref:Uncharacterized protein n=1 Tax=bioreactor metagenome TaxID=1076179 RepID=A0A645ECK5_9ZZZZ
MAFLSQGLHFRPADTPPLGDVFRGDAHGHINLGAVFQQPGVRPLRTQQHRHHGHGFTPACHHDGLLAAANGVGGGGNGLQAAGAVPVDCLSGYAVRQKGPLNDQA